MGSRWSRFKAGVACALACVLPVAWAPQAVAASAGDGRWPAVNDVVQNAWKQGIDGSGVKVAVIDTIPVSDNPVLSDADIDYQLGVFRDAEGHETSCSIDGQPMVASIKAGETNYGYQYYSSHGTDMLSWIVGNGRNYVSDRPGVIGSAPKAKVLSIATGVRTLGLPYNRICDSSDSNGVNTNPGANMDTAVHWGARVANLSSFGSMSDTDYESYVNALSHGVIIVSARANDTDPGLDDLTGDPRDWNTFPGVVMVNSVTQDGDLASSSDTMDGNVAVLSYGQNVLNPVNELSRGDNRVGNGGTSTAAAVLTSYLTLAAQKWPEATGNQLIQSLIRNTKSGKGKPVIDPERRRGFGEVNLNALLTVDPTQYKDVNPILEYQVKAAAQYDDKKDWYTQDCKTNPEGIGSAADVKVPCEAGLIGREYERQQAAWKKVEQCRADGGSDCMRYSATATAGGIGSTGGEASPKTQSMAKDEQSGGSFPSWAWFAVGGGVAVLVLGVVLAVVLGRRRRKARRVAEVPLYGVTRGYVRQTPPAQPSQQWPQPQPGQAPGYRPFTGSAQSMPPSSQQPYGQQQVPPAASYPSAAQPHMPQSQGHAGSQHGRHSR
ncbi:S8 family serine peptidase [Bifidobacterium leontopitheci]|uniref:Subtilase family n=1 Tax=Bifidobacterium leontopitheci TaxID=2650774 RepID=A0A6I1GF43_9BIFI|nr:S8 family serine peptidase [Bifidobacterium leontopitheci]KAB7790165.1 Subtilase family [Bifidobacterium leontopitheci]